VKNYLRPLTALLFAAGCATPPLYRHAESGDTAARLNEFR
jgi:hypothetical protein